METSLWDWASDPKDLVYALLDVVCAAQAATSLEDMRERLDKIGGPLTEWRNVDTRNQEAF